MKKRNKFVASLLAAMLIVGCGGCNGGAEDERVNGTMSQNAVYHWKTTFELDSTEVSFLQKHAIKRLYLRMFDVATEPDFLNGGWQVVPIATTQFKSAIPEGVEVVPVTYITIDALREMVNKEAHYAALIWERLLAMVSYNECGEIHEVQLDCDWTKSTKNSYDKLCQILKDSLHTRGMELSVTIRLHQLKEIPPQADRVVLMLYNTGALKNPNTKNSILHIDDVKPYLRKATYPLPLDYAFPAFGWGVLFEGEDFLSIVSADCKVEGPHQHIRQERPTATEVLQVKDLVEKHFGKSSRGNILYHLDSSQLVNYSDDEITQIYSH